MFPLRVFERAKKARPGAEPGPLLDHENRYLCVGLLRDWCIDEVSVFSSTAVVDASLVLARSFCKKVTYQTMSQSASIAAKNREFSGQTAHLIL